eukprot:2837773-Rhodomonas_salina.5
MVVLRRGQAESGTVLVALPHAAQLVELLLELEAVHHLIAPQRVVPAQHRAVLEQLVHHLGQRQPAAPPGISLWAIASIRVRGAMLGHARQNGAHGRGGRRFS